LNNREKNLYTQTCGNYYKICKNSNENNPKVCINLKTCEAIRTCLPVRRRRPTGAAAADELGLDVAEDDGVVALQGIPLAEENNKIPLN
jgi:hypothetical protein